MYVRTWRKNARKRAILAVLARATGGLSYAQVGGAAGIYPLRHVAGDLAKYHRWGYVRRVRMAGKFRYWITKRGAERLAYFTKTAPKAAPKLHQEVLRKTGAP